MFDGSLPEVSELGSLGDAELVAAASGWARVESAAAARKLAVMAELFRRRSGCAGADERESWWVDPVSAVGAELAAAQGVSHAMALAQAHRGVLLADRLPKVAALFEAGLIGDLLVRTIVFRTALVLEPDALAAVDAALAEQVTRWGALSAKKTTDAIDALVLRHDPAAVRRARAAEQTLTVEFGHPLDEAGYTSLWARLLAPDAAGLSHRLDDMARSVCPDDPRSMAERRAAALAALGIGQPLSCACGRGDCPGADPGPARGDVVIHVVAHAAALHDTQAQARAAEGKGAEAAEAQGRAAEAQTRPEVKPTAEHEPATADHEPAPAACPAPAVVLGGGVISGPVLAAYLARAQLRPLHHPGHTAPEPRYQPSRALADYIRARDLTCRFPGCDHPADRADIDHTIPYPAGPTCAANLKTLCRHHHLLKTFWTGPNGWHDRQLPDGTINWTAPTGHTHTTHPGSALLFPTLCHPTAPATTRPAPAPLGDHTQHMPRRRRTRAQHRTDRITAERKLNNDLAAERNRPPPF